MMEHKGFSAGQIALAFLGGAAAGTAVALLTAPNSGKETRKQLGSYARRGKKRVARLSHTAQDAIDTATDAAREAFEDALAKAETEFGLH